MSDAAHRTRVHGDGFGGALASLIALAAWLGAALLMTAVVAPAAFAVLPTRTLAGALVGRVLPTLLVAGAVVGAASAYAARSGGARGRLRAGAGILVAVLCLAAQFGIGGRIASLRQEIGPSIEALAPSDARRVRFGRLHALSVVALGAAMLAGAAGLAGAALALRSADRSRDGGHEPRLS